MAEILEAVKTGTLNDVRASVAAGANATDWKAPDGGTLLFYAVTRENRDGALEICKFLVEECGVDVMVSDNKMNQTAFFYAVGLVGDLEITKYLLEKGSRVNHEDMNKQTPIFYAVYHGQLDCVRLLLEHSAGTDQRDVNVQTVLFYASKPVKNAVKTPAILKLLMSKSDKSLINTVDLHGQTCLWSVQTWLKTVPTKQPHGQENAIYQALLDLKSNPNHQDGNGQSLLFYAARDAVNDLMRLLITANADVDLADNNRETAIFFALKHRASNRTPIQLQTCKMLVDEFGANVNHRNMNHISPVEMIKNSGDEIMKDAFADLIKSIATGRAAPPPGRTAPPKKKLRQSAPKAPVATRGRPPQSLRPPGDAEPDQQIVDTRTETHRRMPTEPLPRAVVTGSLQQVQELINQGHKPNMLDDEGLNLVFHAARRDPALGGSREICRLLVEEHAVQTNEIDLDSQQSPLFWAVQAGNAECASYLIEKGCDPNHVDSTGRTPIFSAVMLPSPECAALLVSRRCNPNHTDEAGQTPLFCASAQCIEWLVGGEGDISHSDQNGRTPIFSAVERGDTLAVKALISAKADLAVQESTMGRTCLFSAVENKRIDICKELVEAGADPTAQDASGETPMERARKIKFSNFASLIAQLKADSGAEKRKAEDPEREAKRQTIDKEESAKAARTSQLFKAVAVASIQQVRNLISNGADPKALSEVRTSLLFALGSRPVSRGESEAFCQFLVDEIGLDVNFVDEVNQQTALFIAAAEGNDIVATYLLNCGCPVNHQNSNGQTALCLGLKANMEKCVTLLMNHKAKIDIKDHNGLTPLFYAVQSGSVPLVTMVLKAGGDVKTVSYKGETCLFDASNPDIVTLLLERRCQVEATDARGRTALFSAAHSGYDMIVRMLVKARANISHIDSNGKTPLFAAAEGAHANTCLLMVKELGADPLHKDNSGVTALNVMKEGLHPGTLKEIEEIGAEKEASHAKNRAKAEAALKERKQFANTLFEKAQKGSAQDLTSALNCNVDLKSAVDVHCRNAIAYACDHTSGDKAAKQACEILIKHGMNVHNIDARQQTALFAAAKNGFAQSAAVLLDHGCNVDLRDVNGQTALFFAAHQGERGQDTAKLLLKRKANPNVLDKDKQTALFWAVKKNAPAILQSLIDFKGRVDLTDKNERTCLFEVRDTKMVEILLKLNCDPNHVNEKGQTPLFDVASAVGQEPTVSALLKAGARADIVDKDQQTALFKAADVACTQRLLEAACDPAAEDGMSQTPLFFAARSGNQDRIRCLEEHVSCTEVIDINGQTALFYAAQHASVEVCQLLVTLKADPLHKDKKKNTPLTYARQRGEKPDVVAFFEKIKAGQSKSEESGVTCPDGIVRRKYCLVFENPETNQQIPFGSPEYEEALNRLGAACPWLRMDLWDRSAPLTKGPST